MREEKNLKKILSGNEAVARGAYEADCKIAAAYPGTPSTEILENVADYKDINSEWSPNEKVALEVASGSSISGSRSLAVMKHVGLNVAADPFFTIAYEGVNGGLVIVTADEPGMHSSQNEQDNRLYASHAKVAMVEPADSQECKEFMSYAYEISERFDIPVLFRMTTRICHSKGVVELKDKKEVKAKDYEENMEKYLMLPAHARERHKDLEKRLLSLQEYSNDCPLNKIEWGSKEIGIISSGVSYQHAREVFGGDASYLKIGFSHPLPDKLIKKFAKSVQKLYVIEENEPYLENYVRTLGIECIGKEFIPRCGELTPQIVEEALLPERAQEEYKVDVNTPSRPPLLCPGCTHRGVFHAMNKLDNIVVTTDIGCYGLGSLPPLNIGEINICMGAGFSAAIGFQKSALKAGRDTKVFGVLGDSTFFHSGMNSLLDAVYNQVPITAIILDNRITAMTGHQENPGTGKTLMGEETKKVDIEGMVKAIGVKEDNIEIIDPYDLEETSEVLQKAYKAEEPFVIIAKRPCALIKEVREERANMYCEVDNDKCKMCKACLDLGCPALFIKDGQVVIDESMCNGCGMCEQVCKFDAIQKVGE